MNETFVTNRTHMYNGESSAIYRTQIAYTGNEIIGIIRRDVFYAHKPYFLMPDHNY